MRFKKGYIIGAASLAVVALACSVISVKANPSGGHRGRDNHNNNCDAKVTFADNSSVTDALLNLPASIQSTIPSTEGNIQDNLMTLEEPTIGETTPGENPSQGTNDQGNISNGSQNEVIQNPSTDVNNQGNNTTLEESIGSDGVNNQSNGSESTGTTNIFTNTECIDNIVGTSKDVDQSVILYERDFTGSNDEVSNNMNGSDGCTILENETNNTVSNNTTGENGTGTNASTGTTNPNAKVEATEEVNEVKSTTNKSTTNKNTCNEVTAPSSKSNQSTSKESKSSSTSTNSTETVDADVKVLTGTASDTETTEVDAEDDTSADVVEESVSLPVSEDKESIKKDGEAPKTTDKLKVALVVLLLVVAIGIIIMLCIMNRNEVSKEEIKSGFGTNTATN